MEAGKSSFFMAPNFFSVSLWLFTIARRVTCRKKTSSIHNQHKKTGFSRPALLVAGHDRSAAQRGAARRGTAQRLVHGAVAY